MDEEAIDWTGCEWVERVEGRMGGVPTIVGTRVTPEAVLIHFDDGFRVGQIGWMFSLPRKKVCGVLAFAGREVDAPSSMVDVAA